MNDSDEFGFFSNEEDLCGICLESIRVAFRTPGCNHKFHYRCLNKWYRSCYYENRRDQLVLYVKETFYPQNT